jgi:DNA-binding transcriptional LysR family regulator
MIDMAELRRLRSFLAVAEERNFTRAAQRLLVAQPALSRQIRQLEKEIGVPLFERTTHSVELTEAGRFLHERAEALCADEDRMWRDFQAFATGDHSTLTFGYSAATGYGTAPELLAAFAADHPGITVETRLLSTPELLAQVADGSLDAALVRCPPPTPELVRTRVRFEPQGVLLPRDHRLADRDAVPIGELAGERVLLHPRDDNPGHYDAVTALFTRAGLAAQLLIRSISFDAQHTPVIDGQAVSIMGESVVRSLPAALVWRPLRPAAAIEIHLLTRGRRSRPPVARLLHTASHHAHTAGWLRAVSDPA